MKEPRKIDLAAAEAVSHDPGVVDREAGVAGSRWAIAGTRWAMVEYSPQSGRREWCDTPHAGYVVSGTIVYRFEDGRDPLVIGPGEAFALPVAPRHRGANEGAEPARLFLIDAPRSLSRSPRPPVGGIRLGRGRRPRRGGESLVRYVGA